MNIAHAFATLSSRVVFVFGDYSTVDRETPRRVLARVVFLSSFWSITCIASGCRLKSATSKHRGLPRMNYGGEGHVTGLAWSLPDALAC